MTKQTFMVATSNFLTHTVTLGHHKHFLRFALTASKEAINNNKAQLEDQTESMTRLCIAGTHMQCTQPSTTR